MNGSAYQTMLRLEEALAENAALRERVARLEDNLTATQARCTTLFLELRELRAGIVLPGWTCSCGGFNGSEIELHEACRGCGKPRPT
jgi:hypothetical protein